MKEYKVTSGYGWHAWFWVDKEEFAGEWKIGKLRYRVEKAVGRADDGKLFLMVWTNLDQHDWHKFSQAFYEIDESEYTELLDRAIKQGELSPKDREHLIKRMKAPFIPPWDIHKAVVVYRDGRYTLGQQNDRPYLIANGERLTLTCHPYEPCLYIIEEDGCKTAVHNAFYPFDVLDAFSRGETVTSITGREYDALDFCRMVEYAAGMADIGINEAEEVFGNRSKEKKKHPLEQKNDKPEQTPENFVCPESVSVVEQDSFYDIADEYPDNVIDYCLVKNNSLYKGIDSHWESLLAGALRIISDDWELHFDAGKISAKSITAKELFDAADENSEKLNYKSAFLRPPYPSGYTDKDFKRLNQALFPNGTDDLEVYEWTTDWSDYFDDGHEWWGTLCLTVYDKTLDRFVVIMASATD